MAKCIFLTVAFMGAFMTGCQKREKPWIDGGLYYIQNENGSYSILKILKTDEMGVHVRVYSNQFKEPPKKVNEESLHMVGLNKKENETLGMGHFPVSKQSFAGWGAVYIKTVSVNDEELEGYQMWLEAKGGYF